MNAITERRPTLLLFNPFVYTAGGTALWLGLGAILLAGALGSLSRTHFDGVLDTHTGAAAPFWFFLAEGLISWLCLGLVLLGLGKLASKTAFRVIDLLGTQALARWPTILTSLLTLTPGYQRFTAHLVEQVTKPGGQLQFNTPDAVIFLAVILAMIPPLCWMVLLMYKSYSVCCNIKGGKAIGTFILGLILAEILSKAAIVPLFIAAAAPTAVPPPHP